MCSFQFNLLSMITPRYLTDFEISILCSSICMCLGWLFVYHFCFHCTDIFVLLIIPFCVFPMLSKLKSSAKAWMLSLLLNFCIRLSRTRFHRKGDKTPPCGHHFFVFLLIFVFPQFNSILL